MCGIAGIWNYASGKPVEEEVLSRMSEALRHRGPDDSGHHVDPSATLGLAHRRLSILDIAAGHQPMSNEDGSVWIVYNGEIYNFLELNEELEARGHRIRTRCDTETILHLYEEEGPALLDRLNGMFAFAIWDHRERRLLLARDRLGIKPLLYAETSDGILFASELRALLRAGVELDIDHRGLQDFLCLGYVLSPHSVVRGVRRLAPGHRLLVREGGSREEAYWDLAESFRSGTADSADADALGREVVERLGAAVERRLISDVPLGAFLSGGIDSSAIVSRMVGPSGRSVSTFSIGFREKSYDESGLARRAAEWLQTDHHERIVEPDLAKLLPEVTWMNDEPFADTSTLPTYLLCEFARNKVTVALAGDGGDENFAGYETYLADRIFAYYQRAPMAWRGRLGALARRIRPSFRKVGLDFKFRRFLEAGARSPDGPTAHYLWRAYFLREEAARILRPEFFCKDYEPLEVFRDHYARVRGLPSLSQHLYVDIKTWLPDDILTKVDRASMAHSLEVRVPFLDHEFVEFAARVPPHLKLRGRTKKFLLKKAFQPILPGWIVHRPKSGFSSPVGVWFRSSLAGWVRELIEPARIERLGFFDAGKVEEMFEEHRAGHRDRSLELFAIVSWLLWYERATEAVG